MGGVRIRHTCTHMHSCTPCLASPGVDSRGRKGCPCSPSPHRVHDPKPTPGTLLHVTKRSSLSRAPFVLICSLSPVPIHSLPPNPSKPHRQPPALPATPLLEPVCRLQHFLPQGSPGLPCLARPPLPTTVRKGPPFPSSTAEPGQRLEEQMNKQAGNKTPPSRQESQAVSSWVCYRVRFTAVINRKTREHHFPGNAPENRSRELRHPDQCARSAGPWAPTNTCF